MKETGKVVRSMFALKSYFIFFVTVSAIVTCCLMIFLVTADLDITADKVQKSAIITFVCVMILSLICSLVDAFRRKIMVERPVKRILHATQLLTQGDFSIRIEPLHGLDRSNEMDAIIRNFNTMAEELSGIETLRTDFIANVSHELKTPLAIMQNYATMLQDSALSEEKRVQYAKTITEASRRLSDLITNILKLNKLENQQIFPDSKQYNLGEQLCECVLAFEDAWEKKSLDIETDIDEDIIIKADAELLTLVWNNLFSNAVKFSEMGSKITVSLKAADGQAVVKVVDTGCGMSLEVGVHVFEKFYQGDKSHSMQGNGLGLALVKRVVDIMSGEISVESTLGKGSTFTVKLQLEVLSAQQSVWRGTDEAI